jgi:glycosyltransferase involved in cell wall biosynthesis
VTQIYNGVDTRRFPSGRDPSADCRLPIFRSDLLLIGTVGRMQVGQESDRTGRGFHPGAEGISPVEGRLRLVMIGDGPLRAQAQALLEQAGVAELAWLPASATMCRRSCADWIVSSCPRLPKAYRTPSWKRWPVALPVIATDVGGNGELIEAGRTGELVEVPILMRWHRRSPLTRSTRGRGTAGAAGRADGRAALQP